MSQLSVEKKIDIANKLLLQSPPGEFSEVLSDLVTIVGNEKAFKERSKASIEKYNNVNYLVIPAEEVKAKTVEHPILMCKYGLLRGDSAATYVDNYNGVKFDFDHVSRKINSSSAYEESDEANRRLNAQLKEKLTEYLKNYYAKFALGLYYHHAKYPLVLVVESHMFQPRNFWCGQLKSVFKLIKNGDSMSLKHKIYSKVHYYEDGNVQLITTKKGTSVVKNSGEDQAAAIVKEISIIESGYQNSLTKEISSLMETTFKALRRALPITRTKVDWAKIGSYSIGGELKK